MAIISHVKLDYPIKKALYPLSLLLWVSNVKMTYTKSRPETIFQLLNFTFDPLLQCQVRLSCYKGLMSPLVLLTTDSKAGDNRCSSGLVFYELLK